MVPFQKKLLTVFFVTVGVLWVMILALDWVRLLNYYPGGRVQEYTLSKIIKLVASFTVALFVWVQGGLALSRKDHRLLTVLFSVIFLADIGFFLNNNIVGIVLFAATQTLFIIRHLRGIGSIRKRTKKRNVLFKIIAVVPVIAVINCILIGAVFLPRSEHPLFALVVGYSFFLCISVWAGIASLFIGILPRVNAILVAVAVCVLYCGDVMVGLNLMLTSDTGLIISTSLTWTFYLPAIVLFSLSGLRWKDDDRDICFVKEIKKTPPWEDGGVCLQ